MDKALEEATKAEVRRKARLALAGSVKTMWQIYSERDKTPENTVLFILAMRAHHMTLEWLMALDSLDDPLSTPSPEGIMAS
jgi:hypothetical protein